MADDSLPPSLPFFSDGVPFYYNEKTQETQWEKPFELLTPAEIKANRGDWWWIPDAEQAFVVAAKKDDAGTWRLEDSLSVSRGAASLLTNYFS